MLGSEVHVVLLSMWMSLADARPLGLDEALALAATQNPDVRTAWLAEAEAAGEVVSQSAVWDPRLTGSVDRSTTSSANFVAGFPVNGSNTSTSAALGLSVTAPTGTTASIDTELEQNVGATTSSLGGVETRQDVSSWTASTSLSLRQDLLAPWRASSERIAVRTADARALQARLAAEQRVLDVMVSVGEAWWTCWTAGDAVRAIEERVGLARALEETSRAQFEEGTLAALEVDRSTADRLEAERDLLVARADVTKAADALWVLLGQRPGESVEAVGDGWAEAPIEAVEDVWRVVRATSPAVAEAQARVDAAALSVRDARDVWLPSLGLSGSVGVASLEDDPNSAVLALLGSDALPTASVGVDFSIPIGTRASRGARQTAEATLEREKVALARVETELEADVRAALADLTTAQQTVVLSEQRLAVARTTEEGEQARVDEGTKRLDELLTARSTRVEAEVDLRSARSTLGRARIALAALRGGDGATDGAPRFLDIPPAQQQRR